MGKFRDIRGEKYSRLTVLSLNKMKKESYWLCKCDRGNETVVSMGSLKSGNTKS